MMDKYKLIVTWLQTRKLLCSAMCYVVLVFDLYVLYVLLFANVATLAGGCWTNVVLLGDSYEKPSICEASFEANWLMRVAGQIQLTVFVFHVAFCESLCCISLVIVQKSDGSALWASSPVYVCLCCWLVWRTCVTFISTNSSHQVECTRCTLVVLVNLEIPEVFFPHLPVDWLNSRQNFSWQDFLWLTAALKSIFSSWKMGRWRSYILLICMVRCVKNHSEIIWVEKIWPSNYFLIVQTRNY